MVPESLEKKIASRFGPSRPMAPADLAVMPMPVDKAIRDARQAVRDAKISAQAFPPLWGAGYDDLSYEGRCRFIFDVMYTWHDQAGRYLRVDREPYLEWYIWHWHDTRVKGEPLIQEKARRMLITWVTRGLEIHDLGVRKGGLLIAGATYDDAMGFVNRSRVIYEQIRVHRPEWNLKEAVTYGPVGKEKVEDLVLPNGSVITAINQEPESFRGVGITMICCEELSVYRNIEKAWGQAIAICQADPGRVSGHKTAVCNASSAAEWLQLKAGAGEDDPISRLVPIDGAPPAPGGCKCSVTRQGNRLLEIDYWADPQKTEEWFRRETAGMPSRVVRQEYLRDCSVYDGEPIYQDFRDQIHAPEALRHYAWPGQPQARYVFGVDVGQTFSPAGVLLEIGPQPGCQVVAVAEVKAIGNESASRFLPRALAALMSRFPGSWDQIEWMADPDVRRREANYGRSYQQVAFDDHGIEVRVAPKGGSLHARLAAVDWALTDTVETLDRYGNECEAPRFFICGKDCPTLLTALRGGYRNRPPIGGTSSGRDARAPVKDVHSHIANALEYAMLRARQIALDCLT